MSKYAREVGIQEKLLSMTHHHLSLPAFSYDTFVKEEMKKAAKDIVGNEVKRA